MSSSRLRVPNKVSNPIKANVAALNNGIELGSFPVHSTNLKRSTVEEEAKTKRIKLEKEKENQTVKPATAKSIPKPATSTLRQPPPAKPKTVLKPKIEPKKTITKPPAKKPLPIPRPIAKPKRAGWDLKGRLEDMEHANAEILEQNKKAESSVAIIQSELQQNRERVSNLEAFKQTLEESLHTKVKENTNQQSEITELRRKIEEIEKEHEVEIKKLRKQAENEQEELNAKYKQIMKTHDELMVQYEASKTQNTHLQNSVASQSAQIVSFECELRGIKQKLQHAEEEIDEKNKKILLVEELLEKSVLRADELDRKLREEELVRRSLHNTIQELKGNIRVFCRVRPPLANELNQMDKNELMKHIAFSGEKDISLKQVVDSASGNSSFKNYDFTFDKVFDHNATQMNVFEEISQLVQSACDGYNVSIFAYGQTGSGKSFTMEGPPSSLEDPDKRGMIPRSVLQIWNHTDKLKEKGWTYRMEGSYLEIYNETIRDLLSDCGSDKKHEIKHVANTKKTTVTDLTIVSLNCADDVICLLKKAGSNRKVAETLSNERSSRSHSVFMLRIVGENEQTKETCEGVLNLIDLAGSERLAQSGSTGDRLKETQAINKSLSSLGDVIAALANKDSSHIPYRNSKLTYLLQNSLGGNSKTLMFVNVSPLSSSFQESLSSLRFATKVNNCHIGTAVKTSK